MLRSKLAIFMAGLAVSLLILNTNAFACGAMSSINPQTGREEKVWPVFDGQDYEIHWAEKVAGSWTNETVLSSNAVTDSCPALAHFDDGSTAVVWRQESTTNKILYLGRTQISGTWTWQSSAVDVASSADDLSPPWVAIHDDTPWVAWNSSSSSGNDVYASGGSGGGDPWPTRFVEHLLRSNSYTGSLGAEAATDGTHLWVVWIDSATELGYSEFDAVNEEWGAVSYEAYSGPSDVPAAKERVEAEVTGS